MGALSFLHVTASNLEFSSCSISVSTTARAPSHTSSYPSIFLYLAICVTIFPSPAPSAFSNGHHCILDLPLFIKFLSVHPSPAPVVFFYGHHCAESFQADFLNLSRRPTYPPKKNSIVLSPSVLLSIHLPPAPAAFLCPSLPKKSRTHLQN